MDIAILLYDEFTALDCVGPYEVLSRLPGASVCFVARERGLVRSDTGALAIHADRALGEVPRADLVLVPGGPGDEGACADPAVLDWLRQVHDTTRWTTSVCTGALVLGAAGLLDGVEATTHWAAFDRLAALGARPVRRRVVRVGKLVTAAGVSAGIDMALELVRCEAGDELAQGIQLGIEYDPQPPFDAGAPEKAPAEVRAAMEAYFAQSAAARRPVGDRAG